VLTKKTVVLMLPGFPSKPARYSPPSYRAHSATFPFHSLLCCTGNRFSNQALLVYNGVIKKVSSP